MREKLVKGATRCVEGTLRRSGASTYVSLYHEMPVVGCRFTAKHLCVTAVSAGVVFSSLYLGSNRASIFSNFLCKLHYLFHIGLFIFI